MSFWYWLFTDQGIPVLTALIAIVAGVLGGGASQLIAGWFKTRGDTRQIEAADRVAEAAEKRWRHEQDEVRRQYLLEARRDAYVRLLRAANTYSMAVFEYVHLKRESPVEVYEASKNFNAVSGEVALYSQTVAAKAYALGQVAPKLDKVNADNYAEAIKGWNAELAQMNRAMRKDLGLDQTRTSTHSKVELKVAPNEKKQISK